MFVKVEGSNYRGVDTYIPLQDIVIIYINAVGAGQITHVNGKYYSIDAAELQRIKNQLLEIRPDLLVNICHIIEIKQNSVMMRSKYKVTETDYAHYDPSTNNYRLVDKYYNDTFNSQYNIQELLDKINNFYFELAIDRSIRSHNLEDT